MLFGIGAAINFYTGDLHNNKKEFCGLRLIWLERILKESKKQSKKQLNRLLGYLLAAPKMYFEEKRMAKTTLKI